jgi:hypothetical protein
LNLHTLRHYHLKVACLPIPPYAQPLESKGDFEKSEAKNEPVSTAAEKLNSRTARESLPFGRNFFWHMNCDLLRHG